jgi:hypothetical protein
VETQAAAKRLDILQMNREAHRARWGSDPCAQVAADRPDAVGQPTARGFTSAGRLHVEAPGGAWHPVHAADRPMDEARAWLATALRSPARPTAVCVIGAGAGWVVDAVEELPGSMRVLVFEPEPACVLAMFERRDWRPMIDDGRLMMLAGPEVDGAQAAWRLLGRLTADPPQLIHPVIAVARRDRTVAAARLARKAIADARANDEARRRFAAPYLLNTLSNVPSLAVESSADALLDLYPGTPVVIAGAGPSLNRNLEELAPYRDRVVLVAADTALRPILAAGLAPDFVVAVDPGQANARHLTGLPRCDETALVAEASLQPASLEPFAGRTFLFRVAEHQPWPWLFASGLDVPKLHAWGSVLVTAFDLGVKLGGDPLVLIGADLAYTNGQPYCRGTVYEEDWAARVAAGETLTGIWSHAIGLRPGVMEHHEGELIATATHLVQFRDGMMQAIHAARARVVNATGAGILRGGRVERLSLAAALESRPRVTRQPLPEHPPSAVVVETLRNNARRLVHGLDPSPEAWDCVLAEHHPPDPTLAGQYDSVRAALARWAAAAA